MDGMDEPTVAPPIVDWAHRGPRRLAYAVAAAALLPVGVIAVRGGERAVAGIWTAPAGAHLREPVGRVPPSTAVGACAGRRNSSTAKAIIHTLNSTYPAKLVNS